MSVDVEEYFHVAAFDRQIQPSTWADRESRVQASTERLLGLFQAADVSATFFVLGWVAERCPQLVRRIHAAGHEIGSHGYAHEPVFRQTPAQFTEDARRSKGLLEDIVGAPVIGYRAASFSIVKRSQWAFRILEELGFRYSSSVNPVRHDLYGFPEAPRFNFTPHGTSITECPVTTVEVAGMRIPFGGGGYFRLIPYALFRRALKQVNASGHGCYFYTHPWEFDPEQPRIEGASWRSRFRHYNNLGRTEGRLTRLVSDFRWSRFDRVLGLA
jgi:polysaccharide deacetylase family protein (PEP-CTERM system associated)